MKLRSILAVSLLVGIAAALWRAEVLTVASPGPVRPLVLEPRAPRRQAVLDVVLPAVPVGMQHLRGGEGVLLIHYWAPWQRHARAQAALLDSLVRLPELEGLRVAVVCFDPFPSVARFVARQRLRLAVLLDGRGALREALPCPSVPYTYVLDRAGRVAIAQPGEVEWWGRATLEGLRILLNEPGPAEGTASI